MKKAQNLITTKFYRPNYYAEFIFDYFIKFLIICSTFEILLKNLVFLESVLGNLAPFVSVKKKNLLILGNNCRILIKFS